MMKNEFASCFTLHASRSIFKPAACSLWRATVCTILFLSAVRISCFAQDNSTLVTLSQRIIEAKDNQDLYVAFKELTDLYFKANKYNEFVEFLHSLSQQKKTLEPIINYYIAFTRYAQLKHLEEAQNWDEYFSQGNAYKEQILEYAQKTVDALTPEDFFSLYARLILWKLHQDKQDTLSEAALSDLMHSVLAYAKNATELVAIKDVAKEFLAYGEKAKAKEVYRIYLERIVASDIKADELSAIALGLYKEGNLGLAQGLYDVYIAKISQSLPPEKLIPILIDIAKLFAYRETGPSDASYAEKIFKQIEDMGQKDAFDEGLMYLRAFNLEKAKEYLKAKDRYTDLVKRYPNSVHAQEAGFKVGIIYTYVAGDIKTGRAYFEKLALKETIGPWVISSLYQLGVLSQWELDILKAKQYYNELLDKADDKFIETATLAKQRLKEIEEGKSLENNLKTFLDVSFKEEYAMFNMTRLDLKAHPYNLKKGETVHISSAPYIAESGCLQVELKYLWSGHIGIAQPSSSEASFTTSYTYPGTKEINLVVISPAGIVDRNIDLVDVY